jgi:hypothetical protein
VISPSCHVSDDSGGERDLLRWWGCDDDERLLDLAPVFEMGNRTLDTSGEGDANMVGCAKAAMSANMRGCSGRGRSLCCGVSGISLSREPDSPPFVVSGTFSSSHVRVSESVKSSREVPPSSRSASSFGFFRTISSAGVRGDMGIGRAVILIPLSWSATAFLGLLAPEEGAGLPLGGVYALRRLVFASGVCAGWSRLRLGDG